MSGECIEGVNEVALVLWLSEGKGMGAEGMRKWPFGLD